MEPLKHRKLIVQFSYHTYTLRNDFENNSDIHINMTNSSQLKALKGTWIKIGIDITA